MTAAASSLRFAALPAPVRGAAWMLLGFAGFVAWDQSIWWSRREDYSFGWLVPFFVAYVLSERKEAIYRVFGLGREKEPEGGEEGPRSAGPRLRGEEGPRSAGPRLEGEEGKEAKDWERWEGLARVALGWVAGLVFGLALVSFGFGALLRATQGAQNPASLAVAWGFAWLVLATVYLFSDRGVEGQAIPVGARLGLTGMFLFPASIWLISAPLVAFLEHNLSLFLLDKVTAVVFVIFDILGIPIQKEGNVLVLGILSSGIENRVMVEDACSGIRSLMACLFAGSFLAAVFMKPFWKKVLLVGLAMLFAFCTNILRSLFLTVWAYRHGADSIAGAVHDITGYAVLGLTCAGLIALLPLINFTYSLDAFNEEEEKPASAP